jgi:hypothetical protein
MQPDTSQRRLPWDYFLLVFLFAIPIWVLSALLGNRLPIRLNLPISVFLFVLPVIAAASLSYRQGGWAGVRQLLARTFDFSRTRNRLWYVPALLLIPAVYIVSFAIMRLLGLPLPDPIEVPLQLVPVLFVAFFAGAACEELGWSGYALDPMQNRWGALAAAIVLGLVWQIWHVIGQLQAENAPIWILWHSLYSVALRVLMVWIYNNTGRSVFAAILLHASDNVSWALFPNYGTHLNPFILFAITAPVAAAVAILWGPRTLARFRARSAGLSQPPGAPR